jgi:amino acid adenylation domain-containing protein
VNPHDGQEDAQHAATLHGLLEEQARRTPGRPAISYGDRTLTYGELDELAGQEAAGLRARGVTVETVVGVCGHRSLDIIVTLIAIMKAGGAYAPLDPALPDERLAFMIADLGCALVLASPAQHERMAGLAPCAVAPLGECPAVPAGAASRPPGRPAAEPDNLAFVVYTSGSTGLPKAIASPHRGSVNFVRWIIGELGITGQDAICQLSSHTYDAWVWELFAPLAVGGRVVVLPYTSPVDIDGLADLIEVEGVTIAHFVPPVLHVLSDLRPGFARALRWICCSGEKLSSALIGRLAATSPATLVNLYGATEAAIDQTYFICAGGIAGDAAPAGRPLANMTVAVLGPGGQPVPDGETGEIYVAGAGITRGYLNRPRLTASSFQPDPAGDGARRYATGDLGWIRPDGELEFIGRRDGQVKIAGVRVELGEVEAALSAEPGIAHACALASEDRRSIDAFLVGRHGRREEPGPLRARLASRLPPLLVPAGIFWLDRLPLTSSGKVDREALRGHARRSAAGTGTEARDDVEAVILGIWARCMTAARAIGVEDDIFALGGTSLTAARIVAEVRAAFDLPVDLANLLATRTVAGMAQYIRAARQALAQVQAIVGAAEKA